MAQQRSERWSERWSERRSERDIRASDADRETIARWLASAAGEGRITTEEMQERLAEARKARTHGELREFVGDLPSDDESGVSAAPETLQVSASFRDARLRGPWTVPPCIVACAGRGCVLLDFTEAVFQQDEVTVDARPDWNSVYLIVPASYAVTTEESVPGTGDVRDFTVTDPQGDAPRIHVLARPGLGSVVVREPRSHRRWPHLPRRASQSTGPAA